MFLLPPLSTLFPYTTLFRSFVYLCTMVVYNVTISLDQEVSQEWLEWMRKTHVPDVMKTGHFRDCKICRVHGEEEGGITFAIRSEEHTSELQSRPHLVCRLLL